MRWSIFALVAVSFAHGAEPDYSQFEKSIRPVLVEQCQSCHSEAAAKAGKLKGGLKLDTQAGLLKGGDSGPALVPGKPGESLLLKSLKYDGDTQMPPTGKLDAKVIAEFEKWIAAGAADPRTATEATSSGINLTKGREFWAFIPPVKKSAPVSADAAKSTWAKTELDRFVLAKLEEKKLNPVAAADKRTLIRRVTFDLIGLPPTPEEVESFEKDPSPQAFDKVVERLLASKQYGERWARMWLDVARYAEDQAHTFAVTPRTNAFRYRDWVIDAFNADMPYDRFVKLQLAGDLLETPDLDATGKIAGLGFLGLGAEYYKNTFKEQAVADELDDRVDTVTRGFLGLTVSCARCHDHKFDPIPQRDYYSIAGIFNGSNLANTPLVSPEENKKYEDAQKGIKQQTDALATLRTEIARRIGADAAIDAGKYFDAAQKLLKDKKLKLEDVAKAEQLDAYFLNRWVKAATNTNAKPLAPVVEAMANSANRDQFLTMVSQVRADPKLGKSGKHMPIAVAVFNDPNAPFFVPTNEIEKRTLNEADKTKLAEMNQELDKRKKSSPPAPPTAAVLTGGGTTMKVFVRGNPLKFGEVAPKGFLQVMGEPNAAPAKDFTRLDLANAIADKKNPLTARVMVNRVWQSHFGRGLVDTPSNFGKLGGPPSHPELLDALAVGFMENNWSLKWLHRQIVLSATYALSSASNTANAAIDGDNQFLWRAPRRRLDIEQWRDGLLSVAGQLDPSAGGPTYNLSDPNIKRRTVYAKISRHELDGLLRLFDFPDANVTADKRTNTTAPQQQLFALNSEFLTNQARAFSARIEKSATSDEDRIAAAYRFAFQRAPTDKELALGLRFTGAKANPADKLTRWQQYAQILLASNEAMYVD